jgi:predicted nucleic acid-binding protein
LAAYAGNIQDDFERIAFIRAGAIRYLFCAIARQSEKTFYRWNFLKMYLLDTNIVSELRRTKPHTGVVGWIQSINDSDLFISAVTLAEIQAGIELTREQDPLKAKEIESWLDQLADSFSVLPMDGAAFRKWSRLMHRTSDTLYEDAMIAATALVHNFKVVTRNVADFKSFGVDLLNPFEIKS